MSSTLFYLLLSMMSAGLDVRYDPAVLIMADEGGMSHGGPKAKVDIYRDTPIRYLGNFH